MSAKKRKKKPEEPEEDTYKDMLDFIERSPRCALHIERCIENSDLGLLAHKVKNNGRCGVTRAVAMTIARSGNEKHPSYKGIWACWKSYETLAEESYFTPDTCQRAVRDLKATGYLKVVKRPNSSNIFIVDYARLRREGAEGARAAKARKQAAREAGRAEMERLVDSMEQDSYGVPGLALGDAPEDIDTPDHPTPHDEDDNPMHDNPIFEDDGIF